MFAPCSSIFARASPRCALPNEHAQKRAHTSGLCPVICGASTDWPSVSQRRLTTCHASGFRLNGSCETGIMAETAELLVRDAAGWRAWLAIHHESPDGVWLVLAKKETVDPTSLNHDQALEEALCHGWIDGQLRRRDSDTYFQRFTRRRPRSAWSRRNIEIAERLLDEGRMHPFGRAELQRARADGRSKAAYAGSATIEVPPDLEVALAAEPRAHEMFGRLSRRNRYAILYRIGNAKRADTRERRIKQFVEMLSRGETIYPQDRT